MTTRAERMAAALGRHPLSPGGSFRTSAQSSDATPEGYERPAAIPEDPSEVAARRYERNFVREKRAARVSWQNIARMLGRCEAELKAIYGEGV